MSAMTVAERLAAKRGQLAAEKSKGLRTYKWKPGKTLFRIIPGPLNAESFFGERKFGQMWLKSFDGQQKFTIGDRDIIYGEPDPIKDMIFQAMKAAPTEETRDHYKSMLASTNYVFQVLIVSVNGAPDPDAPQSEPQIVSVSGKQFENILAQFETYTDMDPNYDLAGKDTGHLFTCEKSGSGFDTTYLFLATPQKAPLKQEVIDKQHDLDAWIAAEVDGLEQKAIEFLGKLNGAAGISVAVNSGLLRGPAQNQSALPAGDTTTAAAATAPITDSGMSPAAVTEQIEDAVFEQLEGTPAVAATPAADSPFASEPEVTPTPTPTPTPTAAAAPVETAPVATAPAAAAAQSNEIDDILAGLQ